MQFAVAHFLCLGGLGGRKSRSFRVLGGMFWVKRSSRATRTKSPGSSKTPLETRSTKLHTWRKGCLSRFVEVLSTPGQQV